MKNNIIAVIARFVTSVMFLIAATHAGAAIVVSDSAFDTTDSHTSDFAGSFQNQQARSFSLPANTDIQAVNVWGHYRSGLPADNFVVRFFNDVAGVPDTTPFATAAVTSVARVDTGQLAAVVLQPIYAYTFNFSAPVSLTAGTTYYLSVVNSTSDPERWAWQSGTSGNRHGRSATTAWSVAFPPGPAFALSDTLIVAPASGPTSVPALPIWALLALLLLVGAVGSVALRRA